MYLYAVIFIIPIIIAINHNLALMPLMNATGSFLYGD